MPAASNPVEIFCSYAHRDENWFRKLEKHLSILKRQGLILLWHDRRLVPGMDWAQNIEENLNSAAIILLLVSPDFLASDYCYGIEMQRALERHNANEARVIPILLRPCLWQISPLATLQALPTSGVFITNWDNSDDAFADVAAGIRRAFEDLSLFATTQSQAKDPILWNVPFIRNPFFTGRDELLSRLHTQLKNRQSAAISQPQSISGLGGIGKTQTAVEYAYRYCDEYSYILWVSAASRETLTLDFMKLADLLGLPEKDEQDQNIVVAAVKRWLAQHDRWLLILDNADDVTIVYDFLPTESKGHILLTTRAQTAGPLRKGIELGKMDKEEGILLLLRRTKVLALDDPLEKAPQHDRIVAETLVAAVDGLPLALDQAGAYIEETGCSLSNYLELYQKQGAALLKRRGGSVSDHPQPVATTWSLSFQKVEQANRAAADLLRLCAFLAPDAIPEEILTTGAHHLGGKLWPVAADPYRLEQAITALRAYSLLIRNPQERTITVHRLVQTVIGNTLQPETRDLWKRRAVFALDAAFPEVEFKTWLICNRLLPHALLCTTWIEQLQIATLQAAHLLNQVGLYLKGRAQYAQAEPLYQQALNIYEQLLGSNHPDTATILNNLALLYVEQGKYEEAEPFFRRALVIRDQQLGAEHPYMAASLDNLANLYVNQGNYTQAEPLYQRALAIREQQLGPNHPNTATSLNNLGLLYAEQGKYREAEPLYQRALAIREQQLGTEHPNTATSLDNLANLYVNQGNYMLALPLLQRALAIRERRFGSQPPQYSNEPEQSWTPLC